MIHIAVWGAGDSAATHVRSFLKYSGKCRITAVINHNADRAEALVREYGLTEARVFTSLNAAQDAVPVDAVTLAALKKAYDSIPPLETEKHDAQILNFLNAIDRKEPLLVDGAEGRKSMELITAIYESCVTGREVLLPLTETDPFYTAEGRTAALPHFHEKTRSTARSGSGSASFA